MEVMELSQYAAVGGAGDGAGLDLNELQSEAHHEVSEMTGVNDAGHEHEPDDELYIPESKETNKLEVRPLKAVLRRSSGTGVPFSSTATSDYATQRRLDKERQMKLEGLQRQVDVLEQKNLEGIKQRRKLTSDLDTKLRECKFYEKQVLELSSENQHLKAQLEAAVRVGSGQVLGRESVVGSLSGTKRVLGETSAGGTSLGETRSGRPSAVQELRQAREKLSVTEMENASLKAHQSEQELQIKILKEALQFRSEEIGLSGHADLLAKVAKLRGEVSALKTELTNKAEAMNSLTADRTSLSQQRVDLQAQITAIQQRLSVAQQESHRLANSDLGQLLQAAEKERDLLVEYIQSDMNKSVVLTKQVETLESELRMTRKKCQMTEETLKERDAQCKTLNERCAGLEREVQTSTDRMSKSSASSEALQLENESFQRQLRQKLLDEEELIKIQVSLHAQVQAREQELEEIRAQHVVVRTKLQEHEASRPIIMEELQALRGRNPVLERETTRLRQILQELEPKVKQMEPMIPKMQREMEEYRQFKVQANLELAELRQYKQLVEDIQMDFKQIETTQVSPPLPPPLEPQPPSTTSDDLYISPLSSPVRHLSQGFPMSSEKHQSTINPTLTLAQSHSLWVGVSSLRALSPILYERIRSLANDLHIVETQAHAAQATSEQLQREKDILESQLEQLHDRSKEQRDRDQQSIASLTQRVRDADAQLLKLRDVQRTLYQMKRVLIEFEGPKPQSLQFPDNNSNINDDSQQQRPLQPDDLIGDRLAESARMEGAISMLPDITLPDLLQETLVANFQRSERVLETQEHNAQLQDLLEQLRRELSTSQQNLGECEQQLLLAQQRWQSAQRKVEQLESDCQQQLGAAADLTEKQNALVLSLEAKMESLQKDRQLRVAQITALQQREDTLRNRVLAHCEAAHVPMTAAQGSAHLADVIGHLLTRCVTQSGTTAAPMRAGVREHVHRYDSSSTSSAMPIVSTLAVNQNVLLSEPYDGGSVLLASRRGRSPSPMLTRGSGGVHPHASVSANPISNVHVEDRAALGITARGSGTELTDRLKQTRLSFSSLREH